MSTHTNQLFAHAAAVKAAQAVESLATALDALVKAQTRYDNDGGKSAACDIAAAKDRVEAALAREMVAPVFMCAELRAEWRENGGV